MFDNRPSVSEMGVVTLRMVIFQAPQMPTKPTSSRVPIIFPDSLRLSRQDVCVQNLALPQRSAHESTQ